MSAAARAAGVPEDPTPTAPPATRRPRPVPGPGTADTRTGVPAAGAARTGGSAAARTAEAPPRGDGPRTPAPRTDPGAAAGRTTAGRTAAGRSAAGRTAAGRTAAGPDRPPAPARTDPPSRAPAPRSAVGERAGGGAATPAGPVRGRAHSVPVRTGALRARAPRAGSRPARAASPAPAAPAARGRHGIAVRRAPFALLVVALLAATTVGLLVLNTSIAVNSLRATELESANAERAQEVQRLEQQVVAGGTPDRLADAAGDAGLVPAGTAAYLVLGPDGSVVLRGRPEPAPAPEPAAQPPGPPAAAGG
ncbi:hypothetical protein [Geodermatophilus marinus]|uniref:hypothetical protein n=1 Tax=Geodermatophilus sp. LHW52908 TaxID=2303986 RepID=UPI000E3DDBD8|nr:hypothetical protein [Geodermatophilus sp. LHW52908]RFU22585.1 hypothetical protein D0Z06_04920 [Geodermatophilus sp. LHW52908]